ncbi:MAG: FixH family protein [Vicinamibacterales bacterium]
MAVRWNWGTGIALVYAVFASGTIGFAVYAMSQPVDLVSEDYYARSLVHDARLAAIDRVDALGDTFAIRFDPTTDAVTVAWPPAMAGRARGTITLYRPSDASADRVVPLAPAADGRQQVSLLGAATGHWVVQVQWTADGLDFYAETPVLAR